MSSENFEKIAEIIKKKNEEIQELKESFHTKMKEEFNTVVEEFFKSVDDVRCVCWTQYTPYFNDGEPCVFSVNDVYFVGNEFDPEDLMDPYDYDTLDIDLNEERYNTAKERIVKYANDPSHKYTYDHSLGVIKEYEELTPENIKRNNTCKVFADIINSNEELMEEMFGDGVTVYLTRDGILQQDYDHE